MSNGFTAAIAAGLFFIGWMIYLGLLKVAEAIKERK